MRGLRTLCRDGARCQGAARGRPRLRPAPAAPAPLHRHPRRRHRLAPAPARPPRETAPREAPSPTQRASPAARSGAAPHSPACRSAMRHVRRIPITSQGIESNEGRTAWPAEGWTTMCAALLTTNTLSSSNTTSRGSASGAASIGGSGASVSSSASPARTCDAATCGVSGLWEGPALRSFFKAAFLQAAPAMRRTGCEGLVTARPLTVSAPALMAAVTRALLVPGGSAAETYASRRGALAPPSSGGTLSAKRWGRERARQQQPPAKGLRLACLRDEARCGCTDAHLHARGVDGRSGGRRAGGRHGGSARREARRGG
jgi:hypothetical protein